VASRSGPPASRGLDFVKIGREDIFCRRDGIEQHYRADLTAVTHAVCDYMHEHFLTRHAARSAIRKREIDSVARSDACFVCMRHLHRGTDTYGGAATKTWFREGYGGAGGGSVTSLDRIFDWLTRGLSALPVRDTKVLFILYLQDTLSCFGTHRVDEQRRIGLLGQLQGCGVQALAIAF